MFIGSRSSQVTRLVTNSPVARTFVMLSFSCRSAGALQEKINTGGGVGARLKWGNGAGVEGESGLKWERGAGLPEPWGPRVLIQPIGRGATMALNRLRLKSGVFSGSMNNMGRLRFQALQPVVDGSSRNSGRSVRSA